MKLRRLAIARLPGIDERFAIEEVGDGFHLVVGPNGIGKSSLCRAMRALLWRNLGPGDRVIASASFEWEGETWAVERDGSRHAWQREGLDADPPVLPREHLEGCFFLGLRDLLEATADAGKDVAGEIRRQMSGGFDLEAVAEDVLGSVGSRAGRNEQRRLDEAEGEVRLAESRQVELERREVGLADLEARADAAEASRRRLAYFETALEVLGLRDQLGRVESELAALPDALASLSGSELEQLEQREPEIEKKGRQRTDAADDLKDASAGVAAVELDQPLDPADLDTWRARADQLAVSETRLEQDRRDWVGAQAAVAEAGRHLGGGADVPPDIGLEGDSDLFSFLREIHHAREQLLAIDERLRLLGERTFPEDDRRRLDLLRRGIELLRAWLRLPGLDHTPGGVARWLRQPVGVLAAVGLAGMGLLLSFAVHPGMAVVLGAGLGVALAAWLLRPDPGLAAGRERLRRELPAGLDPPDAWETAPVTECLREIESEAAQLEAASLRARYREADCGDLENRRKAAREQDAALEERRRELAARLGLDEIADAAELVDMARALDQLRRARELERSAAARVEGVESSVREQLADLEAVLGAHGEAAATDAASARASVAQLADRDQALRSGLDRQERARGRIRELDDELVRTGAVIDGIYRQAGLERGDRAGLERLLADFARHRSLQSDRDALATNISRSEAKLATAGEADLASSEVGELETAKEHVTQEVAALEDLRGKIADIRAEVKQAREGHSLEDKLADRDAALGALWDCRQEVLRTAAGRFLVDSVRQEHETIQMPRVLERARELFGTFTHHEYELRVSADDAGSFVAREARTGIGRRPDELSDGTRAQLLLAARLAFAEEIETSNPLPLFLDEALDQSDPARFRAIARSLGRMVEEEGRQIFYLTSDPTDVQRIQEALVEEGCAEARTIDLARIRNRAAAVADPEHLKVVPLAPVPSPSGTTPESYAVEIGVPSLDPRRDHAAQHLFYLLQDDLPLLHRLLESRIQHVGQWVTLSRSKAALAAQAAGSSAPGGQIDARCELLETFCRAWREGRGRAVDRDAIEASGAISDTYLERVVEVATESGGDGDRLLEALRAREDERLRRFQTRSVDRLEEFLVEEGYVDPRPILDEAGVVARCMATPVGTQLPGEVAAELVHRWWVLSEQT